MCVVLWVRMVMSIVGFCMGDFGKIIVFFLLFCEFGLVVKCVW